jgi:acetyltransferase-like isoleucine patch superfamily enzyme
MLNSLSILDWKATLQLLFSNLADGKIYFYRKSKLHFYKSSKISVGSGILHFNKKWVKDDPFFSLLSIGTNARIELRGDFSVYSGSRIYVNNGAALVLGSGYINHNLNMSCYERIEIGHGVAISENVTIRDSDNHGISGSVKAKTAPVKIGNNVWIGLNVTILKGVTIGDGAVVAAGSLVNRDVPPGTLVAGVPARVVREKVSWH